MRDHCHSSENHKYKTNVSNLVQIELLVCLCPKYCEVLDWFLNQWYCSIYWTTLWCDRLTVARLSRLSHPLLLVSGFCSRSAARAETSARPQHPDGWSGERPPWTLYAKWGGQGKTIGPVPGVFQNCMHVEMYIPYIPEYKSHQPKNA